MTELDIAHDHHGAPPTTIAPMATAEERSGPLYDIGFQSLSRAVIDTDSLPGPAVLVFGRTEGRFAAHFNNHGDATVELQATETDRLENWRVLQEMTGVR